MKEERIWCEWYNQYQIESQIYFIQNLHLHLNEIVKYMQGFYSYYMLYAPSRFEVKLTLPHKKDVWNQRRC